jgi:uncharacterized protein (TIGR03437 family)
LTISSASGAISGTPAGTAGGTYTVVVTVTDSSSNTATKTYTLTNTWVSVYGSNFATVGFTDTWTHLLPNPTSPLPILLDGISVMIGGQAAYVEYVSATQINVLTPNIGFGPLQVTVTTPAGTSNAVTITSQVDVPEFFTWPNNQPVATHQNYQDAVANGTFVGTTTTPAAPGETIILWGSGFGPTTPVNPFGVAIPATPTYSTSSNVTVTLNGAPIAVYQNIGVLAPGLAGLFQVGVTIPASLANGTYQLATSVNGVTSPTLELTVHN